MRTKQLAPPVSQYQGIAIEGEITPGPRAQVPSHYEQSAPRRRLEGWPLAFLILGGMFFLFCMVSYLVQVIVKVSDKSAERAHELAKVAIEAQSQTQVVSGGGADLWVYVLCLFLGTGIILWVVKHSGLVP